MVALYHNLILGAVYAVVTLGSCSRASDSSESAFLGRLSKFCVFSGCILGKLNSLITRSGIYQRLLITANEIKGNLSGFFLVVLLIL